MEEEKEKEVHCPQDKWTGALRNHGDGRRMRRRSDRSHHVSGVRSLKFAHAPLKQTEHLSIMIILLYKKLKNYNSIILDIFIDNTKVVFERYEILKLDISLIFSIYILDIVYILFNKIQFNLF